MILIVLTDAESNVSLISLPRDLLIEDPCTKKIQRINSSFSNNGCGSDAENLSAVILNITGLKINNFVKFSFEGFENIIDSIGGVNICVNETQREGYSFEIQKGCNKLNGEIALNWIVSRIQKYWMVKNLSMKMVKIFQTGNLCQRKVTYHN